MSNGNFPNEQNLPAGAIPTYLTSDGAPVGSANPLPTTASAGVPSTSVVSQYIATANGAGYSTGDRLQNVVVYNTSSGAVLANIWVNLTTSATLSAPPTAGTYEPYSPSVTVSGFTVQNIEYTATVAGAGWAIGDYLLQTQTFDSATKALISTIWWNITKNTVIAGTVPVASIVPYVPAQAPITGTVTVEQTDPLKLNATVTVANFPATQPVSGTVTANQGGAWNVGVNNFPVIQPVSGSITSEAVANAVAPTLTEDSTNPLSTDLSGNLRVIVAGGSSSSGALVNTVAPTYTDGSTEPLSMTPVGSLRVEVTNPIASETSAVATAVAPTYVEGSIDALSMDLSGNLRVVVDGGVTIEQTSQQSYLFSVITSDLPNYGVGDILSQTILYNATTKAVLSEIWYNMTQNAELTVIPPSASVSAIIGNQLPATGIATTNPVPLTSGEQSFLNLNLNNQLRVDGSGVTQPVSGTITVEQLDPTKLSALNFAESTALAPTYGEGSANPLSTDLSGNLRVIVEGGSITSQNTIKQDTSYICTTLISNGSGGAFANVGDTVLISRLYNATTNVLIDEIAYNQTESVEIYPIPPSILNNLGIGANYVSANGVVSPTNPTYTNNGQSQPLSLTTAGNLRTIAEVSNFPTIQLVNGSNFTQPVTGLVNTVGNTIYPETSFTVTTASTGWAVGDLGKVYSIYDAVAGTPIGNPIFFNQTQNTQPLTPPAGITLSAGNDVTVTNFPTSFDVAVTNFPATQAVSGTVSVSNFPTTQAVSGTVSVSNFPTTQAVSGTVSVSNFPATQAVTLPATVQVATLTTATGSTASSVTAGCTSVSFFNSDSAISASVAGGLLPPNTSVNFTAQAGSTLGALAYNPNNSVGLVISTVK
jgi:hypothetical protein